MKELSVEEKARAYDEAIERAIKIISGEGVEAPPDWTTCEVIFPELKESEDERIRKSIIGIISNYVDNSNTFKPKMLDWLEKKSQPVNDSGIMTGAKKNVALSLIDFLDTETHGMCMSNMECEDLENAVVDSDWSKVYRYMTKKLENHYELPDSLAKGGDYGIDGLYHALAILKKTFGNVDGYQTDDGILSHECAISAVKDLYEHKVSDGWSAADEAHLNSLTTHLEQWIESHSNTTGADIQGENLVWLKTISHKLQNKDRTEKPVFKIGDVLTGKDKQLTSKVIDIVNDMYVCDNCSFPVYQQDEYELADKGEISDGYHTFNELYYYRMLYNAAFFNLLPSDIVHKSKRHHDGEECFGGGWFIVMANLPTGQISNHYELKDWDLFKIPEKEVADEWDGHTPKQAAERLHRYLLGMICRISF